MTRIKALYSWPVMWFVRAGHDRGEAFAGAFAGVIDSLRKPTKMRFYFWV